jgi:hypothetical protein
VLTIENEKDRLSYYSIFFIFNVRVNPDNTDGTVSVRHPSSKFPFPEMILGLT